MIMDWLGLIGPTEVVESIHERLIPILITTLPHTEEWGWDIRATHFIEALINELLDSSWAKDLLTVAIKLSILAEALFPVIEFVVVIHKKSMVTIEWKVKP